MVLSASNSLNVLHLVENELKKHFLEKYLRILFFVSNFLLLNVKVLKAINCFISNESPAS